jgi:hypothetical protein
MLVLLFHPNRGLTPPRSIPFIDHNFDLSLSGAEIDDDGAHFALISSTSDEDGIRISTQWGARGTREGEWHFEEIFTPRGSNRERLWGDDAYLINHGGISVMRYEQTAEESEFLGRVILRSFKDGRWCDPVEIDGQFKSEPPTSWLSPDGKQAVEIVKFANGLRKAVILRENSGGWRMLSEEERELFLKTAVPSRCRTFEALR